MTAGAQGARALVVALLLAGPSLVLRPLAAQHGGTAPVPEAYRAGFESITEARARRVLGFLAGPMPAGRGIDQPGFALAARYGVSEFRRIGLAPRGDPGSYLQRIPVVATIVRDSATGIRLPDGSAITAGGGDLQLRSHPDSVLVRARPVFIRLAAPGAPIAGDLSAADGGIVLTDAAALPGGSRASPGAAVSLEVLRFSPLGPVPSRLSARIAHSATPSDSSPPVSGTISLAAARRLAERCGAGRFTDSVATGNTAETCDAEVTFAVETATERLLTTNVIGLLEGSDPALRDQVVAVGAHLDHLGRMGDSVFYGADDNASGVTALLGVARALAANPGRPRRSVLFLLFTGEESGLVGSRYFVARPTVPLERIIAYVNLDMVGRDAEGGNEHAAANVRTVRLLVDGPGASALERTLRDANRDVGLRIVSTRNQILGGSDHLSFLGRGIPVGFAFTGFHPDYHRPTDTAEKINYTKLTAVTRWIYLAVARLADEGLAGD